MRIRVRPLEKQREKLESRLDRIQEDKDMRLRLLERKAGLRIE